MLMRLKLLDLFCKAGGCSMGYYQAGFDVTGVDIEPQPNYPFTFIQADALTFDLSGYDVIHASPPCQAYSIATHKARKNGVEYPDLLAQTRKMLQASSKPWIIENVIGAPVQHGLKLCGSMFGLQVLRHRFFETSHLLFTPGSCRHKKPYYSIFGERVITEVANPAYTGIKCGVGHYIQTSYPLEVGQQAMGIDWMNVKELCQAIPPAYTKWIGEQLLQQISRNC